MNLTAVWTGTVFDVHGPGCPDAGSAVYPGARERVVLSADSRGQAASRARAASLSLTWAQRASAPVTFSGCCHGLPDAGPEPEAG